MALDRAQRQTGAVGDLDLGQVGVEGEGQYLALDARKAREFTGDAETVEGALAPVGRRGGRWQGRAGRGGQVEPARPGGERVGDLPAGDADQPGGHGAACGVVPGAAGPRREEDLLGDVLGLPDVTQRAGGQVVHEAAPAPVGQGEAVRVAPPDPAADLLVREHVLEGPRKPGRIPGRMPGREPVLDPVRRRARGPGRAHVRRAGCCAHDDSASSPVPGARPLPPPQAPARRRGASTRIVRASSCTPPRPAGRAGQSRPRAWRKRARPSARATIGSG